MLQDLTHGGHHQMSVYKRMVVKHLQFSFLHWRSLPCSYHLLQLCYCIKMPQNAALIMHNINFIAYIYICVCGCGYVL